MFMIVEKIEKLEINRELKIEKITEIVKVELK